MFKEPRSLIWRKGARFGACLLPKPDHPYRYLRHRLIDTYDTEALAKKVVALAPRLQADGIKIQGVRLDSGDLTALSKSVRNILDEGGLKDVRILASGGLDEDNIGEMLRAGAPTSCRNMQTCRAANIRPAKRPGPAASRCGVNTLRRRHGRQLFWLRPTGNPASR
jgi:hypothetical protein